MYWTGKWMEGKRKFYWLWTAIGLLLCLNLLTVGWVVRRTNTLRENRQLAEGMMMRQLDFSPEQTKQYRKSRNQMRRQSKPHEDSLRLLRTTLLDQVKEPAVSDEDLNQLLMKLSRQNRQITRLRFRHWQRVRSICTPDQQARFDQLIGRIGQGLTNPALRARMRESK
ncbi:Spy/CpxP family protein refolding chaperone [Fibrella aquatica]|uniref:Spy/CpxP family protein refolding chaperone n=1 Tax=Fibrella aquatica TaxID=3242487 RepID=UPI0035225D0B